MLFIWLGGGLLLYVDLQEPIRILADYWNTKAQPENFDTFQWIQMFARPLFVFGVMCAVALPKLGAKKKSGKAKGKDKTPGKDKAPAVATAEKKSADSSDLASS